MKNLNSNLITDDETSEVQENSVNLSSILAKLVPVTTVIETEVQKWASGRCDETIQHQEILTDEEIVHAVTKVDVEEGKDDVQLVPSKISDSKATKALYTDIQWAEYNVKSCEEIILLSRIQDKALELHVETTVQKNNY